MNDALPVFTTADRERPEIAGYMPAKPFEVQKRFGAGFRLPIMEEVAFAQREENFTLPNVTAQVRYVYFRWDTYVDRVKGDARAYARVLLTDSSLDDLHGVSGFKMFAEVHGEKLS